MSLAPAHHQLQLPESLQAQLQDFRRAVWSIKMIEAACGALFGVAVSFLVLFALDRAGETPAWTRGGLLALALSACALVPLAMHRWMWRHRGLTALARLLGRRHPQVGDQLLGIIELVQNEAEQARSRALCQAAIRQVADDSRTRNFRDAVPTPRHRLWAWLVSVPLATTLILLAAYPAAAANAWARLLTPWRAVPRYTFAAIKPLTGRIVVPHGEPFSITLGLADQSPSRPAQGTVQLGQQTPVGTSLDGNLYRFELPPQIASGLLHVSIGDYRQQVEIEPMLRPELASLSAEFTLPEYLGLPEPREKDVRGGAVELVNGSRAQFKLMATRELASASVNGRPLPFVDRTLSSNVMTAGGAETLEFRWQDRVGLTSKAPFTLTVTGVDDEAPSLVCEGLPRRKVVLDSETLTFQVRARDDFGVKVVGVEWTGIEDPVFPSPAQGERVLSAGGHDKAGLDLTGTFCAKHLGVAPRPISVRVYVEDYLPGRQRVYSPESVFYVLTPEQHAIWLTEQLSRWHRQSLEVRDRELQLYETNMELRGLPSAELDQPDMRRRIESQASAEQANGRRLSNLVTTGENLVRQATRNPEFGVGHLETWAEMLQILNDISGNRMPSVADLLKKSAQAPRTADASSGKRPSAGTIRDTSSGNAPKAEDESKKPSASVPAVVDRESSQQPPAKASDTPPAPLSKSKPRLGLAVTTLTGGNNADKPPPTAASETLVEAVEEQRDLLAEFEKVADELNRVLAELEGSTLVKRLKAASRLQYEIAGRLGEKAPVAFGARSTQVDAEVVQVVADLSEMEAKSSHTVSLIMDDMQAYFERRRFVKFKTILDDMRQLDVIGGLRQLGNDLKREHGLSIAQCEFWSDTLDRWAEDLVDPSCCGACRGCKSKGSLPPSIVLEVLQILEGEVNLREETRVAEQARPAIAAEEHMTRSRGLSETQAALKIRVYKVIERIRELPDAESDFGKELALLSQVSGVMQETAGILVRPETGSPAIAAETEAIELLLQSKRINPKGSGGGGGSTPGGGGGGDTNDSAIPLLGGGVNQKEVREDRGISQATGETGRALPEEFRAGLDEYFNRLERGPQLGSESP